MGIQTTLRATSTTVTTLRAAAMRCGVMLLSHPHLLAPTASPWRWGGSPGSGVGSQCQCGRAGQGILEDWWEHGHRWVTSPGPQRMLIVPVLAPSQAGEHSPGPFPALGAAKLDTPMGKL